MKGIYLGACRAVHENYKDLVYQDIDGTRDIGGDMMSIDLRPYDYVICTPPCNFWSRANYRRFTSSYSQITMHLLPCSLVRLALNGKPFLIENVRNESMFKEYHIFELCDLYSINVYFYGRHTYFSNLLIDFSNIPQVADNIVYKSPYTPKGLDNDNYRQGGINVHNCVDYFLEVVHQCNLLSLSPLCLHGSL